MCVAYVSGNFLEDGGGEKISGHTFPQGEVPTRTLYTHRPYLDLDFRKKRNLAGRRQKNVTWQGGTKET